MDCSTVLIDHHKNILYLFTKIKKLIKVSLSLFIGLLSPYLNHNAIDPVTLRNAKAFCGYSGNQISDLKTLKKNVLVRMPSHLQYGDITMYNQLCLYGMQFQPGDSGTCVYVDTPAVFSRHTGCIGMLIGQSTCGHYVLTPMNEILKAFEL